MWRFLRKVKSRCAPFPFRIFKSKVDTGFQTSIVEAGHDVVLKDSSPGTTRFTIQNAMIYFYEYPDEMHDLIKFLTDWELEAMEDRRICHYL